MPSIVRGGCLPDAITTLTATLGMFTIPGGKGIWYFAGGGDCRGAGTAGAAAAAATDVAAQGALEGAGTEDMTGAALGLATELLGTPGPGPITPDGRGTPFIIEGAATLDDAVTSSAVRSIEDVSMGACNCVPLARPVGAAVTFVGCASNDGVRWPPVVTHEGLGTSDLTGMPLAFVIAA